MRPSKTRVARKAACRLKQKAGYHPHANPTPTLDSNFKVASFDVENFLREKCQFFWKVLKNG
jgi:hypothetical protein